MLLNCLYVCIRSNRFTYGAVALLCTTKVGQGDLAYVESRQYRHSEILLPTQLFWRRLKRSPPVWLILTPCSPFGPTSSIYLLLMSATVQCGRVDLFHPLDPSRWAVVCIYCVRLLRLSSSLSCISKLGLPILASSSIFWDSKRFLGSCLHCSTVTFLIIILDDGVGYGITPAAQQDHFAFQGP